MNITNNTNTVNEKKDNYMTRFTLAGKKLFVVWSFHALRRAEERLHMNEHEVDAILKKSLQKTARIPSLPEQIVALTGDWVVFDAEDQHTFVLTSNGDNRLYVLSCGSSDMHPHDGSMTLQINAVGKIRLLRWTKPEANRVPAGMTRTLNNRNLTVYWVGECAKLAENTKMLRILKSQIAKTMALLSLGAYPLNEGRTINVWNWQTHTFFSINIHPDDDSVDVILFRSARFQCKRECIRIDITKHGCEYVFPFLRKSVKHSMPKLA